MTMRCEAFEELLEAFVGDDLPDPARTACERHVARCEGCAELVELATVPAPAGGPEAASIAAGVLRRTTGSVCARAELHLAGSSQGRGASERSPVEAHLAHCAGCRSLAAALQALDRDLPTLAELPPGRDFVPRVLAASLPLSIRLRRWRRQTWPRLVRRPRFAIELAYVLTALVVVVVNIPGTPLAAMPRQAVDLVDRAKGSSLVALEEPVRVRLDALGESAGPSRLGEHWEAAEKRIGTFWQGVASWWESATEDSSSNNAEPTEESS